MVCIEKYLHFKEKCRYYAPLNFRYFTCLLDKGHIKITKVGYFLIKYFNYIYFTFIFNVIKRILLTNNIDYT